ncbi:hypothetical protein FNH05_01345 [Amycolatopsis rhizosphaerae]|uniref:Uncharacterized protein n=1 Tax=Amycolatopsis rhizosphaerae TaxID=2053003 RepID=A0A558DMC4_9PSEU|nr:hypothetical protein [Amycolatopsis rhizosphaerae]TVT62148.1 hypothetical protein FNH05_01345 [Amycolatopsis rhizosphaerae]
MSQRSIARDRQDFGDFSFLSLLPMSTPLQSLWAFRLFRPAEHLDAPAAPRPDLTARDPETRAPGNCFAGGVAGNGQKLDAWCSMVERPVAEDECRDGRRAASSPAGQ